jgi:hypothetical protein
MKTIRLWIASLVLAALMAPMVRGEALNAEEASPKSDVLCQYLVTVANDYIVEAYRNGEKVPDEKRELILDRFGATIEKIQMEVRRGDWLVFHVVHNHLRWGGTKYFAVAGCQAKNEFGFVSDPASADWSSCDDPAKVSEFIKNRDHGIKTRARTIENPWSEGDPDMKVTAGENFGGKALWGGAPSTWIKFVAPGGAPIPPSVAEAPLMTPKRWPVQILSAIYGTGGKNADVTLKVKDHVEEARHRFSVSPPDLGADPNPYWNKSLHIIYMKDGVRREQRRGENEWVLPESFYGPQDVTELKTWLPETRWIGAEPDIQFHNDHTFTSPGVAGSPQWEAIGANKLRLTWSEDHKAEFVFDYTWSSFSEVGNAKNVYHLKK